jgi:hypothetical protein
MKIENIIYSVFAFILGMLLVNMFQDICGCKVVEGHNSFPSGRYKLIFDECNPEIVITDNDRQPESTLPTPSPTTLPTPSPTTLPTPSPTTLPTPSPTTLPTPSPNKNNVV